MRISKHRVLKFALAVALLIGLVAAIVAMEPFTPRHQGRTVRGWVRYYAAQPRAQVSWQEIATLRGTNVLVDPQVIEAFGTNAFAPLLSLCRKPLWFGPMVEMEMRFGLLQFFRSQREKAERIEAVARLWGTEWAMENVEQLKRLLSETHNKDQLSNLLNLTTDPLTGVIVGSAPIEDPEQNGDPINLSPSSIPPE
ncbi:MAG TPA: hypothetical protein VM735_05560 [Candidatus Kapabacteria bacterium]|nr:hypothetical protein [Candidatus Kapabacteria bacterium]